MSYLWYDIRMKKRNYIQARNLLQEAKEKLRETGILCRAFSINGETSQKITITKQCWNHVFKHPVKRPSRIEKLERALCLPMAVKLLEKTTTYQEVSKEKDKGGNEYLFFGLIGYVRGNRIKVVVRKQEKNTDAKLVLFSFYQMSSAPLKKEDEDKKV